MAYRPLDAPNRSGPSMKMRSQNLTVLTVPLQFSAGAPLMVLPWGAICSPPAGVPERQRAEERLRMMMENCDVDRTRREGPEPAGPPRATHTPTSPTALINQPHPPNCPPKEFVPAEERGSPSVFTPAGAAPPSTAHVDMYGNPDSKVEYEIMEEEEEHKELGGLAFELEVVDPAPEQVDTAALELMDIDEYKGQDPELETESEAMSSEENQEQFESSSGSSGSDPDWVP
ncbi:hypothetical protein NL676_038221 [Syzygium grande]|nr:hypothetical protein NL676_038221 [Syzygium grande]